MPTAERYAKDKEYYQTYHRSEGYKQINKAKFKKRIAEGKCDRCGHVLIEGAYTGTKCVNCKDYNVISERNERSFF